MVWLFVTDRFKYSVIRVTDQDYFSKYHDKEIIISLQPTKSILVKDMINITKNRNNPQLTQFVKEFIEDHPEYQI